MLKGVQLDPECNYSALPLRGSLFGKARSPVRFSIEQATITARIRYGFSQGGRSWSLGVGGGFLASFSRGPSVDHRLGESRGIPVPPASLVSLAAIILTWTGGGNGTLARGITAAWLQKVGLCYTFQPSG